jgi:hypothetical protein
MPVRDRQRLITDILATVLGQPPGNPSFGWMTNKQAEDDSGEPYVSLRAIFKALRGNAEAHALKRERPLNCDASFGGSYNFIFEFDEIQHFSSFRLKTFDFYPQGLKLGYNLERYRDYCKKHMVEANSYRQAKTTDDFPFAGGRTAQRAYFDAVRDLLPPVHGLNPTLRIAEFEVARVVANDKAGQGIIRDMLRDRLPMILPPKDLTEVSI